MLTTDPHEAQLLAAVVAAPADDAPRLAYADWIETHGDEGMARAEFIRLQIEGWPPSSTVGASFQRMANKLKTDERLERWSNGLAAVAPVQRYIRGFFEVLVVSGPTFLARADELCTKAPLEHLRLGDMGGRGAALAACARLEHIKSLAINGPFSQQDLEALVASPHLGRLRSLGLNKNGLGFAAIETLASAMPHLAQVDFSGNEVELSEQYDYDQGVGTLVGRSDALEAALRRWPDLAWLTAASRALDPLEL